MPNISQRKAAKVIVECREQLIQLPQTPCLVHCISRDKAMGAGFAKQVKAYCNSVKYPVWHTPPKFPNCYCWVTASQLFVNLITKEKYSDKPTIEDLYSALTQFEEFCKSSGGITKIWDCPKLGCGLDRLNWEEVKVILEIMEVQFRVWGVF